MKKVLLAIVLILTLVVVFVACDTPADTTADETTAPIDGTTTDSDTEGSESVSVTTLPSAGEDPEGELEKTDDYTAVLDDTAWVKDDISVSEFTSFDTASNIVSSISRQYNGYTKTYHDGEGNSMTVTEVRKLGTIGVIINADESAKTVDIQVEELSVRAQASWKSVTARAGSYLMFDFTTNLPIDFYMTVTATKGGAESGAAYTQGGVSVSGSNGKYTGVAKCTVPYAAGKTFYINICVDNETAKYPVVASIPVEITTAKYDSQYSLIFQGDWELIRHEDYLPNLVDLFYNVYPRLYARFAFGTEPKQITFMADKSYDGVAYCAGTTVCVSVDYANANPTDLGFFSHEITHSVQQYGTLKNYGGTNSWTDPATGKVIVCNSWWTENMANYGGFRYFHWGYSTKFVQIYNVNTQSGLWNWNWEPYGDGSKLFLSYLDYAFPSVDENGDGKLTVDEYGIIDLVNYTIKTATSSFSDHPYDPTSPFNIAVATATDGKYTTMEEVRQKYEADCRSGAWKFVGFRDYVDNWRTEDLSGIPNPTYPMWETAVKGNITNDILADLVTEGTNLALNATVYEASGEAVRNPVSYALDGDLSTFWHASNSSTGDYKYELQGYPHSLIIDLGEVKSFNTYTLVNRGYINSSTVQNTYEWEILISTDGKNWTSIDYQNENTEHAVSINVGDQSARYIELRIHKTDRSNTDNARIVEFMLFG